MHKLTKIFLIIISSLLTYNSFALLGYTEEGIQNKIANYSKQATIFLKQGDAKSAINQFTEAISFIKELEDVLKKDGLEMDSVLLGMAYAQRGNIKATINDNIGAKEDLEIADKLISYNHFQLKNAVSKALAMVNENIKKNNINISAQEEIKKLTNSKTWNEGEAKGRKMIKNGVVVEIKEK